MLSHPRNALCIICTDHRRSLEFYRDAFNAEVIPGDVGTCPWLRIGDLPITLVPNADTKSAVEHSEHAMATLLLQVDDLHAAYAQAIKFGAQPVDPPHAEVDSFIVTDPDGTFIEVMQAEREAD